MGKDIGRVAVSGVHTDCGRRGLLRWFGADIAKSGVHAFIFASKNEIPVKK